MTKRFEQGQDEIAALCRYFAVNRAVFSGPTVNEAQVRQALIDPLFEALGWDVRNAIINCLCALCASVVQSNMQSTPTSSLRNYGHHEKLKPASLYGNG